MQKPLSEAFRKTPAQGHAPPSAELEATLATYLEAARAPWPEFGIDPVDFIRYVSERAEDGQVPPLRYAPDLWLACACVQRVPAALVCFQKEYEPLLARLLRRQGAAPDVAEDVQQVLSERLFVADAREGRRAKMADYKGLGALKGWVSTSAVTTLITQQRAAGGQQRVKRKAFAEHALLGSSDPELEYLKARYRAQVHDAIVVAVGTLNAREKALLTFRLKERLSIDTLGAMYGVDRTTVARWLVTARHVLKKRTIERLRACLELKARECESLLALVNSQLEVSLLRHLELEADGPGR